MIRAYLETILKTKGWSSETSFFSCVEKKLLQRKAKHAPFHVAQTKVFWKFQVWWHLQIIYNAAYLLSFERKLSAPSRDTLLLNEGIPRALKGKKLCLKIPRVLPLFFELFSLSNLRAEKNWRAIPAEYKCPHILI